MQYLFGGFVCYFLYFTLTSPFCWSRDILYFCSHMHCFYALKRKETLPCLWPIDEELPPIHHGNPITDRRSTFQAHLAPVVTTRQVSRDQLIALLFLRPLERVQQLLACLLRNLWWPDTGKDPNRNFFVFTVLSVKWKLWKKKHVWGKRQNLKCSRAF